VRPVFARMTSDHFRWTRAGVVYKARDVRLVLFVAIKVVRADAIADSERRRRLVQEAKAMSTISWWRA